MAAFLKALLPQPIKWDLDISNVLLLFFSLYTKIHAFNVFSKIIYIDTKESIYFIKGMEHVPNIFISFDKYLFLKVLNILIWIGIFKQSEIQLFKRYLKPI